MRDEVERGSGLVAVSLPARARRRMPWNPDAYRMGKLSVFVGQEGGRWHLSVAHPDRLPTWDEIKYVRRKLLPEDVHFCLPWPTEEYWLNVHNYCLHLWELDDEWLIEQMEFEGESPIARIGDRR